MMYMLFIFVFLFKQKTAYEMRISDWSSDVCSSDLGDGARSPARADPHDHRRASRTRRIPRKVCACAGGSVARKKRSSKLCLTSTGRTVKNWDSDRKSGV